MKYDEFLKSEHYRKKPFDEEHRIQAMCVRWFRFKWMCYARNLFAVPNGGRRDQITGAKLKEEGVLAGVSDLILLVARGNYHGLCIEMKTKTGRQSDYQKDWQRCVEAENYKYIVARSYEDFREQIENYLNL